MHPIFDTHAHYDNARFDEDRDTLLAGMPGNGVGLILNAACVLNSTAASAALAERYSFVYASAGIHPHEAAAAPNDWAEQLKPFLRHEKCVAIGEIGLDYHYDFSPRAVQRQLFEAQMTLAAELHLPVIIHEREALTDTLAMLQAFRGQVTGVFHCFSNSVETARTVLNLGYDIALGGTVTFKNAHYAPLVAAYTPADRLLVETDCPYMAPVPMRGRRNDSTFLRYTIETIAALRNETFEETTAQTYQNGCRLFGIPASAVTSTTKGN